jgi:hypothetical protein
MTTPVKPTVKHVRDFFGMNLTSMKEEWMGKDSDGQPITDPSKVLTELDKEQLMNGIANGTLTY